MIHYAEHGIEKIDLNTLTAPNPASRFLVVIDSNAMTGAGCLKGDLAIVDKDVLPTDGCLVIAFTDKFLLRRYVVNAEGAWLVADPMSHEPIPVQEGMVWGVVAGVQRRY